MMRDDCYVKAGNIRAYRALADMGYTMKAGTRIVYRDEAYYLADECVKAVDLDDYIDIDDACEDIDGEWQLEEDCEWSDYHNAYILSERCHYSEAVGDYVDEDRAETCPVCGDWIPEDYDGIIVSTVVEGEFCCDECRLKAEAAYRKVHALRVVS